MGKYDDIIFLNAPTSKNHPRMSMNNRAAQFAPFAALVGYAEAITESRENEDIRRTISEDKKEEIEGLLHKISAVLSSNPTIEVIYYSKENNSQKGKYITYRGKVKKVDTNNRTIVFVNKKIVPIKEIYDLIIIEDER